MKMFRKSAQRLMELFREENEVGGLAGGRL